MLGWRVPVFAQGIALLSAEVVQAFRLVGHACLAAIALAAGAELHLSELQRTRRQVQATCEP
jgi:hypothetical protein